MQELKNKELKNKNKKYGKKFFLNKIKICLLILKMFIILKMLSEKIRKTIFK